MTKNIQKILAALCLALLLAGCTSLDSAGYTQVSSEKAAQLMEDYDDEIVLDVRTPEEYAEAHIPGAINVPNEEIGEERSQSCRIRIRSSSFTAAAAIAARRLRKSWQTRAIRMSSNLAASKIGTERPWFIKQHRPTRDSGVGLSAF